MTIQNSTFGFIDYFVDDSRQRIACQLFPAGKGLLARLDAGGASPVLTTVAAPMQAEVLGAFSAVLERYKTESAVVLAAESFWIECEAGGGSALRFFQVVHHMRLFGATVSQALDASIELGQKLRASECAAARAIYEIFVADLPRIRTTAAPRARAPAARAATLPSLS